MTSSQELFSTLLQETLVYMKESCHPNDKVVLGEPPPQEEWTPPPPPKAVKSPPPPKKKLPPPPVKEVIKDPEPSPPKPALVAKPETPPQEASRLKSVLLELAPAIFTDAPIPDDALAEKKRHAWKEKRMAAEVTILSFESHSKAHLFLQNLATAIDARLRPARVALATLLENENRWELFFESSALKHLIAFPIPFDQFPNLRKAYRENPQAEQKFLNTTPLLLVRPYSEYQTDPLLKKELWNTLCTQLSS